MLQWEEIAQEIIGTAGGKIGRIYRASVPGGWLVVISRGSKPDDQLVSFFYPDENHSWTGDTAVDRK